jgi:tetrahydromethanopterin S-methyltransferase subunit F
MPQEPGPIARRWESLAAGVRFAIVFVISSPILYELHIHWLNQPEGRGLFYGVFWGAVLALLLLGATHNEKARRIRANRSEAGDPPEGPPA